MVPTQLLVTEDAAALRANINEAPTNTPDQIICVFSRVDFVVNVLPAERGHELAGPVRE